MSKWLRKLFDPHKRDRETYRRIEQALPRNMLVVDASTKLPAEARAMIDAAHAACGVPPEFMLVGAERAKPLPCPDCEERREARIREADWFAQRLLGPLGTVKT